MDGKGRDWRELGRLASSCEALAEEEICADTETKRRSSVEITASSEALAEEGKIKRGFDKLERLKRLREKKDWLALRSLGGGGNKLCQ